jgi:hypothetical protein
MSCIYIDSSVTGGAEHFENVRHSPCRAVIHVLDRRYGFSRRFPVQLYWDIT